ncbi:hypothetical protein GY45DRAFT_1021423 [Cubamyces sp. BRFM 1775]|nr:hypothetical protein GY45DRAFT_1021423 [Cubamyces sp. BRFM 1775]
MGLPRFQRCARCKCRYYCSRECQKKDWTPEHHRFECALLCEGKEYEVECHRKLHDNGWWFNHGSLGPESILLPPDADALPADMQDDWMLYGRRNPPRDVSQQPDHGVGEAVTSNTHGSPESEGIRDSKMAGRPTSERLSLPFTIDDIPQLPPLPTPPGFTPTGEALLWNHIKRGKSPRELLAELVELNKVLQARCEVLLARREMALHLAVELALAEDEVDEEGEVDSGDGYGTDWESLATVSESSDSETLFSSDDECDSDAKGLYEMAVKMHHEPLRGVDTV